VRVFTLLLACAAVARAQDPFEIHVYEYEPLPPRTFSYEAHMNYVARGTKSYDALVAPTQGQFHFTSELTAGITDDFRAALVLLTAKRADQGLEYAGFRVLPHIYAPQNWRLPLNLGFVAEFSFARAAYVDNPWQVELRPIIEKHIGRLQLDGNPVFSHALRGANTKQGWVFEPAARIGWQVSRRFTPSLEYYGSWGPVHHVDALGAQQVFAGGDVRLSEHLTWSLGAGCGAAEVGSRWILKSRFELEFEGPRAKKIAER
jgi:hypothetical protein